MSALTTIKATSMKRLLPLVAAAAALLLTAGARAAAPGITGPAFALTAQPAYITQPDGQAVYSWGYGCTTAPASGGFVPASLSATVTGNIPVTPFCNTMQVPGPTLVVTEGVPVSVTLTNGLPPSAGNTSILFPGFNVTATGGVAGLLTQEAAPGSTVMYTFTPGSPGTRAYYSGTQGDLQVEMGLYGALIVLPSGSAPSCPTHNRAAGLDSSGTALVSTGEFDYRLSSAAYHVAQSCYDREYLFQFSEMDPNIHNQALAQVTAIAACNAAHATGVTCPTVLSVPTEPYSPAYFMINGRSMPDDMDTNYAAQY